MSVRIRELLAVAAGPESQGDKLWHVEGIRRLYFENPNEVNSAGMVDVPENEGTEANYVRVELHVTPEVAAEIISHVTGREGLAARVIAVREISERMAEEKAKQEAEREKLVLHGDGLEEVLISTKRLNREDDARNAELSETIASTGGLEFGTDDDEAEEVARIARRDERKRLAEIEALAAEQKEDVT